MIYIIYIIFYRGLVLCGDGHVKLISYADGCWSMLKYAEVCWRMLTYTEASHFVGTATSCFSRLVLQLRVAFGLESEEVECEVKRVKMQSKASWASCCSRLVLQLRVAFVWVTGSQGWYANVCWLLLTYADTWCFTRLVLQLREEFGLESEDVQPDVCWRMLTYADACWQDGLSDAWTVDNDARFPTYPGWFPDP